MTNPRQQLSFRTRMGDIKPLTEAIRNSVRSAIILFDMTRVVEELIFNSLDADATKISVAVGAETCYLKISDNGCGITRDGLALVAERYASSKFNEMEDSHAVARSFGFRGEALSSIANVSLLEILTKTQGRPNGYRKVMKGCKCLHIGIDDGRQDIGTTVIVRDLFYNQPVRRKLIQSSTKKELESVKNCVLRISLVHPKVSFKVVDIESDDELFCSCPSSPLSRVMSAFGVEVSNSLQELNVTDGLLELSGFMSSPCDISSVKAFQYIYINSRYISKGAIHKLLNQLANSINSLQQKKGNMVSQIANQSKTQTCCSFILNVRCPRSWYDVAFESSKTSVDFKDWKAIIGFIEKAITRVWSEIVSHGDALSEGTGAHVPTNNVEEIQAAHTYSRGEAKYRADNRKNRVQDHASPVAFPSPSLEMQSKKYGHLDRLRGNAISCADVTNQNDSFIKSFDEWPATTRIAVDQEIGICDWRADHNVFPNEDQLVGNKYFVPEKYKEQVDFISKFGFDEEHQKTGRHNDPFGIGNVGFMSNDFEKPFLQKCTSRKRRDLHEDLLLISEEFDASLTNKYLKSDFPIDHFKIRKADNMNKVLAEPFLQRCTSRKKRSLDDESFLRSESSDFPMEGLRYKRTNTSLHRKNDLLVDTGLDFRSRSHGFEHDFDEKPWRGYEEYNYIAERGNMDQFFYSDGKFCSPFRGLDTRSDFKTLAHPEEDSLLFHPQDRLFDVTSPGSSAMFIDETKGLSSELYGNDDDYCCIIRSPHKSVNDKDRKTIKENLWKTRLRRSHSAPPFFQGKNKAFALSNHSAEEAEKGKKQSVDNMGTSQEVGEPKHHKLLSAELEKCEIQSVYDLEADESKHPKRSSALCPMGSESNSTKDLLAYTRETNKGPDNCSIRKKRVKEKLEDLEFNCTTSVEDYQDPVVRELKWRDYPKIANGDKTRNSQNEDTILNVYSGQLQLAGDLLVPKSISRNFLNNAKVLQQVDKKFIPVVGNGVLAVIDQHAADERIRLEELRQKVLAGEKKSITYLDVEQKLVMPEMGYQLLHTYAEQTQKWGWLFDSQSQDSKSFKKNLSILHKQQRGTTLVAVPCILGVNLTDVDLLEFLQQLADTDGSSTIPPSVHRVLNSKACRGAIMFGDTLLPSECSLIVDELKQTSLCFQCAHGRPTTVPLINLEALQKQIEKLGSWNAKSDTWHGLQRHVPSLERVISRLNQTEVQCS